MNEAITLFKHNPSAYEPELREEITVQREKLIADLVDAALDFRRPRHQLLVGPRGMGKTHLLSLVESRVRARSGPDQLVVAWLEEDAWTIRTYEKLLAEIASLAGDQVEDPVLQSAAQALRTGSVTGAEGEQILLEGLGDRRLLLMIENLDRVFRKIREEGQARLRDLVEDWGQVMVLAAAPQVFGAIVEEDTPFHDFFEVTELEELTVDSAMELMRRIAKLNGDQKLLRYLGEERAKKRFAAIEALAGGHPRIWLLFAGCISVEAIDELVPLFLKALDELTPYYQARLDELGDQQQELVVLLSEAGGALSNRALAERSGIAQNQVASMLRQLTDKGYVRPAKVPEELAAGDSRMSFWELREPLMRLCLDVKKSRGKPLQMVIEFLRAWYGSSILDELTRLPAEAELAATYASEAFRTLEDEIDVRNLLRGSPGEILERAEVAFSLRPEMKFQLVKVAGLFMKEDFEGAKVVLEQLLGTPSPDLPRNSLSVQLAIARTELGEQVDLEDVVDNLHALLDAAETPVNLGFVGSSFAYFDLDEEALVAYEKAVEMKPDEPSLQAQLGATLGRLGRDEEALDPLRRATELEPTKAEHFENLGIALGNLGRLEEALEAFTGAVELEPDGAENHLNLGITLRNLGREEEALVAIDRALDLKPEDAYLHDRRGRILHALGRPAEALEAFDRAVELGPQTPTPHSNRGTLLAKEGRLEEALEEFTEAVSLYPEDPLYQGNLGETLYALGRLEEALPAFTIAAELEPENVHLHVRRGGILLDFGRFEEALAAYDKALELDSSTASVWNNRGIAFGRLDRWEEALESFSRAAEINPSNANYQGNKGSALGNLGRIEEALEVFAVAIDLDPTVATLHTRLGMALDDLDRFEEALAAFAEAAELDPEDPSVHDGRANALRSLNRLEEAERAARRAVELAPKSGTFRFTLAEVLLAAGDFEKANEALHKALAGWAEEGEGPVGDPELLCRALWNHVSDPTLPGLLESIADAYTEVGAIDELVRGIVGSISLFVDEEVGDTEAEAWVEAWASVPATAEIEIPVRMLRAALAWKRDRDRAHLLELPLEQREILVELLNG